jgi:ubiquinone/menaquinone biosynthesis C-methylase UbiE
MIHFMRRWIKPNSRMRILDLATGSGDIPRLIVDYARRIKASVAIEAVDQQTSTIEIAPGLSRAYPEIEFLQDNILTLARDGRRSGWSSQGKEKPCNSASTSEKLES